MNPIKASAIYYIATTTIVTVFFFAENSIIIVCASDKKFEACASRTCGDGLSISFPFYIAGQQPSYCGYPGFNISCRNNQTVLGISFNNFLVHEIFQDNDSFLVSDMGFLDFRKTCSVPAMNLTLVGNRFDVSSGFDEKLYLYNCSSQVAEKLKPYSVSCDDGTLGSGSVLLAMLSSDPNSNLAAESCYGVGTFIKDDEIATSTLSWEQYEKAVNKGFLMDWNAPNCSRCRNSGGRCGYDENNFQFWCYCSDRPHSGSCIVDTSIMTPEKLIGIIGALIGAVLACTTICWCKRKQWIPYLTFQPQPRNSHRRIEDFIRDYESLARKRYSYSSIKRMTNSFKLKLGQGGYGCVYEGQSPNGSLVAVKVLNSSKGRNGEEFINEVASISRTSHVNIVALKGFCFERNKRALIYEYMPNGSLDRFIRNDDNVSSHLGVKLLHQIAIGIAQGLAYLHRGCSTRILHCDIKPHNILLDEHFVPKISDFGLAKLCPSKESIVSLTGTRGTIGYVAPEMFNRNFGGVSHKSDVYSYGMMILEMVGGRKNSNVDASHSSEMYFPESIYKRLQLGRDFVLQGSMTAEENDIAKRMIIVGLWCIQPDQSHRPSMSKVIDMLGGMETLQVPPNPFLFSPPRSLAAHVSSTFDSQAWVDPEFII